MHACRSDGFTPLHCAEYNIFIAAVFGDDRAVMRWLEKAPSYANFADTHARRPLSAAAWRGDVDMVRLLLAHGADPALAAAPWATPVAWATQRGHDAVLAALSNSKRVS